MPACACVCACECVCVCARARSRAWPLCSCPCSHPTPHPTPPHRASVPPPPRCAGCAAGCCSLGLLPPRLRGDPRCAPGSKAPRYSSSPSGGRGGEGGGAGARKAGAHSRPALRRDGQLALKFVTAAANSWTEPGRSELAAGLEPPQLEDEAHCVLLERPSAATGVCPPGPVLPRLIGVHGAGAVAPFRVHSNLRRRIGASPPAWRCWQERGTPGRPCSRI